MKASMHRMLPLSLILALSVLLPGCAGSESTAPTIPDVVGSYSGKWTLTSESLHLHTSVTRFCPGNVDIDSQAGGALAGSYRLGDASTCHTSGSGAVAGEVRSGGRIDLSLGNVDNSRSEFEEITGCAFASGDSQLTGSADGNMSVEAEFKAECPDGSGGTYLTRWVVTFAGTDR